MEKLTRMTVCLPHDVIDFLDREASWWCTSRNAQIIRLIRERIGVAMAGDKLAGDTPAIDPKTAVLQDGNLNTTV